MDISLLLNIFLNVTNFVFSSVEITHIECTLRRELAKLLYKSPALN